MSVSLLAVPRSGGYPYYRFNATGIYLARRLFCVLGPEVLPIPKT